MTIKIGHACQDERGKFVGGKAGDQTGKEVYVRKYYNNKWTHVIRFTDSTMANKVAECMQKACENDKIGYNQYQRNTLLNLARKVNYDPSKVTSKCNTDCSALVTLCCIYAGIKESKLLNGDNSCTTSNLRSTLNATGKVKVYKFNNVKESELETGDILLKEGYHVAVVVDGISRSIATQVNESSTSNTEKFNSSFKVASSAVNAKQGVYSATYEAGVYEVKSKATNGAILVANKNHTSGGWYYKK